MSKGNVFLDVLTGLAIGVILGVLFAPAKGSETRQKISDKGNEFADTLKKKFDEFIDGLIEKQATVNEETTDNPEV
ncbi:MAG: YtxH domain-containing protein [Bacteroidales bacterium]